MSKTKAKRKSGKSSSKGFLVDPITGSRLQSDVVYGPDSDASKAWARIDTEFVTTLELEYSPQVLILNISSSPASGEANGLASSVDRFVYNGKFSISKKGNIQGRIDYATHGTYYPSQYPSGSYEMIEQDRIIGNGNFKTSSGFRSVLELNPQPESTVYSYTINLPAADVEANAANGYYIDTNKGSMPSSISRFFSGDWWTDPFASNLV